VAEFGAKGRPFQLERSLNPEKTRISERDFHCTKPSSRSRGYKCHGLIEGEASRRRTSFAALGKRTHSRGGGEQRHFIQQAPYALSSTCTTMDITPIFNQVLVRHDAQPVESYVFRVEDLDEFLQEAYRIVGHVAHHMFESNRD
jgi:hypothetical protein